MGLMTPGERIEAAVGLREPDRVPIAPNFDVYVARKILAIQIAVRHA
jgi:hypothetical protein